MCLRVQHVVDDVSWINHDAFDEDFDIRWNHYAFDDDFDIRWNHGV